MIKVFIALFIYCISFAAQPYPEWRENVKADSKDAYYMPRGTAYASSTANVIGLYNYMLANSDHFNKCRYHCENVIRYRYNCNTLYGWTIGRIIESYEGSNIVKVEFQSPFSDNINKKYVVLNTILPLSDYVDRMAK
jgi:hypothetical protein